MLKTFVSSIAIAGFLLASQSAVAADAEMLTGKIASVEKEHITLEVDEKTQQVHVNSATQVTLDGERASLSDLKKGFTAKVTAMKGDDGKLTATKIEANSKATFFVRFVQADEEKEDSEQKQFQGSVKAVDKTQLQITDDDRKTMAFEVGSATTITLDGKRASLADLKPGHQATVKATQENNKWMARSITATSKAE